MLTMNETIRKILLALLESLADGAKFSLHPGVVEIDPVDGWRRFRATNKYILEVHPACP